MKYAIAIFVTLFSILVDILDNEIMYNIPMFTIGLIGL